MIKKKICLLGYFAVGKTSLVKRFVYEVFSEKYHTTIGVKIDKKLVVVEDEEVQLLVWDIHGEDRFQKVQKSYLMGASGYLLVVDATRIESLDAIDPLQKLANEARGEIPFFVLINKTDLVNDIVVTANILEDMGIAPENIVLTSAKTGDNVENAFLNLTRNMLNK